ncbi:MAG: hypothetical protein AAGA66_07095 [Bacteroidota bacterium]
MYYVSWQYIKIIKSKRMAQLTASTLTIFILISCALQGNQSDMGMIEGKIGILEGNCMPGPGIEPCKPRPIATTVYATKLSRQFDIKLVVDSTESKQDGTYQLSLPEGRYSLFIKDEERAPCDRLECNPDCYCLPFKITADSTTTVSANLNHAAW